MVLFYSLGRRGFSRDAGLFIAKRNDRVDLGGAARRKPAGEHGNESQRDDRRAESGRVETAHVIEETGQGLTRAERAKKTNDKTNRDEK